MRPAILSIVIILALLVTGAFFYGGNVLMPLQEGTVEQNLYANGTYRISFQYPANYLLTEREVGNGERGHYTITLIQEADATLPENGEGSTTITIDVYQNDADNLTLLEWLNSSNDSNFKLGNGTYASTTVDGNEAVSYHWSGLYEGETTAFLHNGNIVAVSVTYLTREDQIRADYYALLASLNLE